MEPRLVKGAQADYELAVYSETSGLVVYHNRVLVKMDKCSPRTKGGVSLPEDLIEKMTLASESGVICGLGADAFKLHEDLSRWDGDKPVLGDRVYVERYAGVVAMGRDGEFYRIMDHRCVAAGIAPEVKGQLEAAA